MHWHDKQFTVLIEKRKFLVSLRLGRTEGDEQHVNVVGNGCTIRTTGRAVKNVHHFFFGEGGRGDGRRGKERGKEDERRIEKD